MTAVMPICLALVLCDRVGRARTTGKASPLGIFQAFPARSFPATTRPFSAWMQLHQGNGVIRMKLVFERLRADIPASESLFEAPFSLRFDDPNEIREHVIDFVDGIELPCAGSDQVRLTAAGATIMTRPFITPAD